MKKVLKKLLKWIVIAALFFVIGGFSGVFMERFGMPWLSSKKILEKYTFFQKANERVTVINKTEQITVSENFSLTKTAQNVLPAVVSIVEYSDREVGAIRSEIKASKDIQESVKTGVILTSDGLILSVSRETDIANGTQAEDKKYKIFVSDGRELDAKKISSDSYSMTDFYKVEESNLPAAQFGNSNDLETGEKLIVIGNASGEYQNTFSLGVINEMNKRFSLLNSELSSSEKMEGAIICDALINVSNIGGPVVDFNGTVVGIANYILKDGEYVGFVIPINKLQHSIDSVITKDQDRSASLGLYYLSINKEISLLNSLSTSKGALVYSFTGQQGLAVKKGTAADVAGILLGDIIMSVDEKEINLDNPLSQVISTYHKGDEIELILSRDGTAEQLTVVLD